VIDGVACWGRGPSARGSGADRPGPALHRRVGCALHHPGGLH